jgi:prepilin signal peptidase PulO-like enzyme (type II secretory pathway)
LLLHRATRTSQLPLGPFIVIGTLAAGFAVAVFSQLP